MRDGFVSPRLSSAASSLASLAPVPQLPSASPAPVPFPSNLNNAAASPLPLSPSITPSLSLARLIDPDPVLFSSLFDSRRVTRTDSPVASRRARVAKGERRARGGWRRWRRGTAGQREGRGGQVRRTGPAIYIFISSSWRAIGDRENWRKRKEKKRKRTARGRKIFGHSPENASIGRSFSIRFARIPIRDFAHEGKKRNARGYVAGATSHSCGCVSIKR